MNAQELKEIFRMKTLDISELNEENQAKVRKMYEYFLEQQNKKQQNIPTKA